MVIPTCWYILETGGDTIGWKYTRKLLPQCLQRGKLSWKNLACVDSIYGIVCVIEGLLGY
jgi:hypothetical protein